MPNVVALTARTLPDLPSARGYHAVYRPGEVNHCPGCGRTHWMIGRLLAECAFCATALPLMDAGTTGVGLFRRNWRGLSEEQLAA